MEKNKKSVFKVGKMHILENNGPLKAFCDLILFDSFIVKGLRVVEGKEGLFVGMPSEQGRDGKWFDTFHPLNRDTRKAVEEHILVEYIKKNEGHAESIT